MGVCQLIEVEGLGCSMLGCHCLCVYTTHYCSVLLVARLFKGQTTPLSGQYKNGLFPKILFPLVIFLANMTTKKFDDKFKKIYFTFLTGWSIFG
jgi:hypothetical protein